MAPGSCWFHPDINPDTCADPVVLSSYQASQRGGRAQVAVLPRVASGKGCSGSGTGGGSSAGSSTGSAESSSEGRVMISGYCVTVMKSVFTV